jgi:hypothetical protein
MHSSMSVVSMLSFSSLKNEGSMDGGSDAGGAAAAAIAAAAQATTRSWSAFMGLLPGVTPLLCLWALSSSSQGSLLQVREGVETARGCALSIKGLFTLLVMQCCFASLPSCSCLQRACLMDSQQATK